MSDQPGRASTLVRVSALLAALLLAMQVAIVPASAAPAADDELIVAPSDDGDGLAATPAEAGAQEDEAAGAPVQDGGEDEGAGEAVAEPPAEDPPAEAEATPAPDDAESAAEPVQNEPEVAAEPPQEDHAAPSEPEPAVAAALPALDPADVVDDLFLRRLLDAINALRDSAGTQRLTYVPARANSALDGFLQKTAPSIAWPGPCGHNLVNGSFSWDYVVAAGFGGDPRGEVIACPGPEPYWTPDRVAARWWDSPIHHDVLYADGASNSIACSAYGVRGSSGKKNTRNGGSAEAASAVLCVTFRR